MATSDITLTHLDEPLFDGANATKRHLVDYLDAVADRILPGLRDRPLSVIRVREGSEPFMQKNVPNYAPSWIKTMTMWAAASKRDVRYALCGDRDTLIWFANQRAVEYHVTLGTAGHLDRPSYVVLDIDPPDGKAFGKAVAAVGLIRQALADAGLAGAVKTSGAKGLHIYVPVDDSTTAEDAAAATRALAVRAEKLDPSLATTAFVKADRGGKVFLDSTRAHGATVVAVYSPRARPDVPVSFPVAWHELESVSPRDFTIRNAAALLADRDPWAEMLPAPQALPPGLVEEGHAIPVARVQAMHEGKRRARAARDSLRHRRNGPCPARRQMGECSLSSGMRQVRGKPAVASPATRPACWARHGTTRLSTSTATYQALLPLRTLNRIIVCNNEFRLMRDLTWIVTTRWAGAARGPALAAQSNHPRPPRSPARAPSSPSARSAQRTLWRLLAITR